MVFEYVLFNNGIDPWKRSEDEQTVRQINFCSSTIQKQFDSPVFNY